jgi:hypothetical protein
LIFLNKSFLYRNLKTKTWSQKLSTGKVVDRPLEVIVFKPKLVVSQAGRDRVRRTKRKTVHAGIRGLVTYKSNSTQNLFTIDILKNIGFKEITYNPYKCDNFVLVETGLSVFEAEVAYLTSNMKVYILQ